MGNIIKFDNYRNVKCDKTMISKVENSITVAVNCLYILIGIPCSGKSTYAESLSSKKPEIVVIATDEIRKELTGTYKYFPDSNNSVFSIAKERIDTALSQGFDVIFDATNTNSKYRQGIIRIAKKNKSKAVAVVFKTPLSVCLKRNKMRTFDRKVPEDIIIAMSQYDSNTIKFEGFEEILVID